MKNTRLRLSRTCKRQGWGCHGYDESEMIFFMWSSTLRSRWSHPLHRPACWQLSDSLRGRVLDCPETRRCQFSGNVEQCNKVMEVMLWKSRILTWNLMGTMSLRGRVWTWSFFLPKSPTNVPLFRCERYTSTSNVMFYEWRLGPRGFGDPGTDRLCVAWQGIIAPTWPSLLPQFPASHPIAPPPSPP